MATRKVETGKVETGNIESLCLPDQRKLRKALVVCRVEDQSHGQEGRKIGTGRQADNQAVLLGRLDWQADA